MTNVVTPDLNRGDRIGIDEAVLCDSKSDKEKEQIIKNETNQKVKEKT